MKLARFSAGACLVAATALLTAQAAADVLVPPPKNCPIGARGSSTHYGPYCAPARCKADGECNDGKKCKEFAVCVKEVPAGKGDDRARSEATASCNQGETCPDGSTCTKGMYCIAESAPPPASASAAPPVGSSQAVPAAPPSGGCRGCTLNSSAPGLAAIALAGAALGIAALRRRRFRS